MAAGARSLDRLEIGPGPALRCAVPRRLPGIPSGQPWRVLEVSGKRGSDRVDASDVVVQVVAGERADADVVVGEFGGRCPPDGQVEA